MKLLLACDDYIYYNNGKYYAASQEKANFYSRYLRVFDELRLVARCKHENSIKNGRVLLDNKIDYIPLPFFQGPLQYAKTYFKIGKILHDVTDGCHAAILRLPSTVAMRITEQIKHAKLPLATEIVYDAHDGFTSESNIVRKLLWKFIDIKMRKICYSACGVSCVTQSYLQRRYYSKIKDAFYSSYSSLDLPNEFYTQKRLFPKKNVFVIVHVANQIEYNGRKGHIELLKVLKLILDMGVAVKIKFVGADYFGGINKLKNLANRMGISENIDFLGYLGREELSSLLDICDLFVLPTKAEGLPRVVIEAMAKGLPCITTIVSGNSELLPSEYLFEYDDIAGMSNKIYELITSKEKYEQASDINFKKSQEYASSILEYRRDKFYTELKNRT